MLTNILIGVGLYLIVFPILLRLIGVADARLKARSLQKKMAKGGNKFQAAKDAPEPIWRGWQERFSFTVKDKREFVLGKPGKGKEPKGTGITRSRAFFMLHAAGLIVSALTLVVGIPQLFGLAAAIFIGVTVYAVKSPDQLLKMRKNVYKRMLSVARTKLGQSGADDANPQAVVRVLEWQDYIKPMKVEFDIPDTFSSDGQEGFMRQYNQLFGNETAWVPADNPEEPYEPGWDYDKGLLTIKAVPPLPTRADWHERYVLMDEIAWSFFPIGLSTDNGLEITNPDTGEKENIIGFDLSGEQAKVSKQYGIKQSGSIAVSPMVLIGGSTGGGKSLSISTPVKVFPTDPKPEEK